MNYLSKIKAAGFNIEIDGSDLLISPCSKLTQPQLAFLKTYKAEIISELKKQQTVNDKYDRDAIDDRHNCHECRNLINCRCITQRFKPVDDIPRRCSDFVSGRKL